MSVVWRLITFFSMLTRYTIALSVLALSGCTLSDTVIIPDKTDTGIVTQTGAIIPDSLDYQPPQIEDLSGSGNFYYPIFRWLETKIIPITHTKGVTTKVSFINSEATSMRVIVTFPLTETGGNLRLSQIIMPDGNMDGPFSMDNTISLEQTGRYELIFHENMMSGDPWSGSAIVTIRLIGK